ncbi:NAD(P)/FAD-dependent oxidoreductase [Prosthecobacter sp.]|uniref:NAD(P)/FAD-dependent oxidoreductase n=1 Tax=Prosthecobacter sp. TaxID=1965333 RepID=UPI002ABAE43C|nr:NAD(P)/FAD-dependent oxidoreductase [Prosthecobacter sp.]MDZ4405714.1 NAD(P)/FAD-dependent oxidoreductase [Prosthecobacter sp.]
MNTTWDVIIIGGGPAGSTAASTLRQAGRKVLVLEKEKFPRFHIGESLLPYNRAVFEDLGVWPKIEAAGFMVKRGAQFWMGDGSIRTRLNFSQGSFTEFPESIQVERAKFDDILLRHAEELGAEVREEALVTEHRIEKDRVTIKFRTKDGSEHEAQAAFLVDASGLTNFTANREKLRDYYPGHKKIAIFGHYSGVQMTEGEEKGDILIIRRKNSWFWMIPLEDDKTSVGLVLDQADFKALNMAPQAVFDDAVLTTKTVQDRMINARSISQGHVLSDFSYTNRKLVSDRVVRVGDASGFIDPIFSSGVMLAMSSGQRGSKVVHAALTAGKTMTFAMRHYEWSTRRNVSRFWQFIEKFYTKHFAQLFFQPSNKFRMVCAINCALAGRTRMSFATWWRLRIFFALVWLQKRFSLAKPIEIG